MKKKLFGNNIEINCNYCEHSLIKNECQFCRLNRTVKNGKCRKFKYNPIMRVPIQSAALPKFTPEDFAI